MLQIRQNFIRNCLEHLKKKLGAGLKFTKVFSAKSKFSLLFAKVSPYGSQGEWQSEVLDYVILWFFQAFCLV